MSTTSAVGKGEAERGLMGAARAEGRGSVSVACIPDSRTYSRKQDPVFQTPPHSPTGPKRDVGGRSPTEKRGPSMAPYLCFQTAMGLWSGGASKKRIVSKQRKEFSNGGRSPKAPNQTKRS